MAFFSYRAGVDAACAYASLQCSTAGCSGVVPAHMDLVGFHEAAHFEVQPEHFAIAVPIDADSRYERFGRMSVIEKVPAIARYARRVVQPASSVKLEEAVGLEVKGLGVVGGEEQKGLVEAVGVARIGERKMWQVVCMDLRLVCAGAHDPVTILAHADAVAGLVEAKVLQQLDAVGEVGVLLQAALSFPHQPVGEGPRSVGPGDGVYGHCRRVGDLHWGGSDMGWALQERGEAHKKLTRSVENLAPLVGLTSGSGRAASLMSG